MLGWLPSLEKQVCYHIVLYSAIVHDWHQEHMMSEQYRALADVHEGSFDSDNVSPGYSWSRATTYFQERWVGGSHEGEADQTEV